MKKIIRLLLAASLLISGLAHAGTKALGFEIGVSTVDQVRSVMVKQTRVMDAGENKYSAGPMLKTDGTGYDIQGLNSVVYIFDPQQKLLGVVMGMNKNRFDVVFKMLADKYKVVAQERPFVGDRYARFKTQDATIQIEAPHLSFDMDVSYLRDDLLKKLRAQQAAETAAKKRHESAQF